MLPICKRLDAPKANPAKTLFTHNMLSDSVQHKISSLQYLPSSTIIHISRTFKTTPLKEFLRRALRCCRFTNVLTHRRLIQQRRSSHATCFQILSNTKSVHFSTYQVAQLSTFHELSKLHHSKNFCAEHLDAADLQTS